MATKIRTYPIHVLLGSKWCSFDYFFFIKIKDTDEDDMNITAPNVIIIDITNLLRGNFSYLLFFTLEKNIPIITTIMYLVFLATTWMG